MMKYTVLPVNASFNASYMNIYIDGVYVIPSFMVWIAATIINDAKMYKAACLQGILKVMIFLANQNL